ncbi:hypothetical protein C8J56DRAFT_1030257 [Mycena floridula]|nr:hypothetical protein C8J56DRAFT_1030257 [Mycena floridula]
MFLPSMPFENCSHCGLVTAAKTSSNFSTMNRFYFSHLHALLPLNHSTSDALVSDEITVLNKRLSNLDDNLIVLRNLQEAILCEQGGITQAIALRQAAIAPIRKLPNELLEIIFLYAHSGLQSLERDSSWLSKAMELPISEIILGDASPEVPNILHEWLRRSSNHSLILQIAPESVMETELDLPSKLLLSSIAAHSGRWKDVAFDLDNTRSRFLLSQIDKGQLLQLERLEWAVYDGPLTGAKVDIFSVAPQLRRLKMSPDSQLLMPWSQIEQLVLVDGEQWEWELPEPTKISFLQRFDHLVECNIKHSEFSVPTEPFLVFNQLRTLCCHADSLSAFLRLPALDKLDVIITEESGLSNLLSLVQRSNMKLSTLTINRIHRQTHVVSIVDILIITPDLHSLNLILGYSTCSPLNIIDFLHIDANQIDQVHLPRLQHLSLQLNNKDAGKWVDMVESRAGHLAPLKSLHFLYPLPQIWSYLPELKTRINSLESRGLKVSYDTSYRQVPDF